MIALTCVAVPLSNGRWSLVDTCDEALVRGPRWRHHNGYASRKIGGTRQYLHRLVCKARRGLVVDHINGDKTDNCRQNLRVVRQKLNCRNITRKPKHGITSRYKGVSWDAQRCRWFAKIQVNGKQIALGRFTCEQAAAEAYAKASRLHHGDFGCPEAMR